MSDASATHLFAVTIVLFSHYVFFTLCDDGSHLMWYDKWSSMSTFGGIIKPSEPVGMIGSCRIPRASAHQKRVNRQRLVK